MSIYRSLLEAGPDFALHHGFTYSGHPVVCAAALANLDILEREQLIQRARKLAPYFARRLATLRRHALVGDVRAVGLMGAVELVSDRASKEPVPTALTMGIRRAALGAGVIVRASGNMIVVCPPLIVGRREIDRLVHALDDALGALGRDQDRGSSRRRA